MKQKGLGNPALITAVASNPKALNTTLNTAKIALGVVVVGFAGYFGWQQYKNWRRQKFVEENGHKPDVQSALILRKAMVRLEFYVPFFGNFNLPDGTDEDTLFAIAQKVSSFEDVVRAYKIIFDSNLVLDVQNELTGSEMISFYNALNAKADYNDHQNQTQTPFLVGQDIKVLNSNGANTYKVIELNDGQNGVKAGEALDYYEFDEVVGTILRVVRGDISGKYYYIVDRKGKADWLTGNGWIAHSEVTKA